MNRRDFLKALTAVGVSTALAKSIADDSIAAWDTSPYYDTTTIKYRVAGESMFEQIVGFRVYGDEMESRVAEYMIKRVNMEVPLLKWALNTSGSLMEWRSGIHREYAVLMTPNSPVEIVADFDGASTIFTEKLDEHLTRQEYYFVHRRRLPIIGFKQVSETQIKRIGHEC